MLGEGAPELDPGADEDRLGYAKTVVRQVNISSQPECLMLNKVSAVKAVAPHVLRITFQDGYSGIHDFAALFDRDGPMAEPLRNPDYFARVFLEYGALTWPNGYDMCPDWLRMEIEKAGEIGKPVAAE